MPAGYKSGDFIIDQHRYKHLQLSSYVYFPIRITNPMRALSPYEEEEKNHCVGVGWTVEVCR